MKAFIRPPMNRQRGVGIIEVLVAVLVLSVGLLGLAGLQLRTLRNNESALERGAAVVQTHAIADALRADRTNAIAGLFNIALAAAAPTGTTFHEYVIATWRNNLVSALGTGATGSINCNGPLCTIQVQWDDSRGSGTNGTTGTGSSTLSITTQVQI